MAKYSDKQKKSIVEATKAIKSVYPKITDKGLKNMLANIGVETNFSKQNTREKAWSWNTLKNKKGPYASIRKNVTASGLTSEDYNKLSNSEKLSVMYYGDTAHNNAGGFGALQLTSANYGGNDKTEGQLLDAGKELGLNSMAEVESYMAQSFFNNTLMTMSIYKNNRGLSTDKINAYKSAGDFRSGEVNKDFRGLAPSQLDTLKYFDSKDSNKEIGLGPKADLNVTSSEREVRTAEQEYDTIQEFAKKRKTIMDSNMSKEAKNSALDNLFSDIKESGLGRQFNNELQIRDNKESDRIKAFEDGTGTVGGIVNGVINGMVEDSEGNMVTDLSYDELADLAKDLPKEDKEKYIDLLGLMTNHNGKKAFYKDSQNFGHFKRLASDESDTFKRDASFKPDFNKITSKTTRKEIEDIENKKSNQSSIDENGDVIDTSVFDGASDKFFGDEFNQRELNSPEKFVYNKDDFGQELPLGALAQGALALKGLADADVDIPLRDEMVSQAVLEFAKQNKKISLMGLSPEEEMKMKNAVADNHQNGMDALVKSSGGNRNIVLGGATKLNANRIKGLNQIAIADINRKAEGLAKYGETLEYIENFNLNRDKANHAIKLKDALETREAGAGLASGAFTQMLEEIQYQKENGPGSAQHMQKSAMENYVFGHVNGMKDDGTGTVPGTASYLKAQNQAIADNNETIRLNNETNEQFKRTINNFSPERKAGLGAGFFNGLDTPEAKIEFMKRDSVAPVSQGLSNAPIKEIELEREEPELIFGNSNQGGLSLNPQPVNTI